LGNDVYRGAMVNVIRGVQDSKEFAKALVKANFDTGSSKTGGRNDFEDYPVTIVKHVKVRLNCQKGTAKNSFKDKKDICR